MALCLDCKADYIRGITVCPACGRALEPDPPAEPELSSDFVPVFMAPYATGLAARASLEAAGLDTQVQVTDDFVAYSGTPFRLILLVRERDLPIARSILRL